MGNDIAPGPDQRLEQAVFGGSQGQQGVADPVWQVVATRVSAIVSPLVTAVNVVTVLGKATPGPAAPAYTEVVRPVRP